MCIGFIPLKQYKRDGTNEAKQKRSMGKRVQARYCSDIGVPRMKAGEAATAMTNWCNHPKGKRGLAIPSKVIMDLSQVLCWFGGDFAKPVGMRPFYRSLKLFTLYIRSCLSYPLSSLVLPWLSFLQYKFAARQILVTIYQLGQITHKNK